MEWNRCAMCAWRRRHIQEGPDETDAPLWACDSSCPRVLRMLHTYPGDIWWDIISTNRLCSPRLPVVRWSRVASGREWQCIPLRCETGVDSSDCVYHYENRCKAPQETVTAYHNTRLESLIRPTQCWDGGEIGNGILVDGRFRYGCETYEGHRGVNIYSDGGLETFEGATGWVQLEVRCTNTTKLKGGREHRYCICGPRGKICYKAALVALGVPLEEVPPIVRVA